MSSDKLVNCFESTELFSELARVMNPFVFINYLMSHGKSHIEYIPLTVNKELGNLGLNFSTFVDLNKLDKDRYNYISSVNGNPKSKNIPQHMGWFKNRKCIASTFDLQNEFGTDKIPRLEHREYKIDHNRDLNYSEHLYLLDVYYRILIYQTSESLLELHNISKSLISLYNKTKKITNEKRETVYVLLSYIKLNNYYGLGTKILYKLKNMVKDNEIYIIFEELYSQFEHLVDPIFRSQSKKYIYGAIGFLGEYDKNILRKNPKYRTYDIDVDDTEEVMGKIKRTPEELNVREISEVPRISFF
jgi:hypothetical protein